LDMNASQQTNKRPRQSWRPHPCPSRPSPPTKSWLLEHNKALTPFGLTNSAKIIRGPCRNAASANDYCLNTINRTKTGQTIMNQFSLKTRETASETEEIGAVLAHTRKSLNPGRTSLAPGRIQLCAPKSRAYLRALRAAELAAWEITGGDYL